MPKIACTLLLVLVLAIYHNLRSTETETKAETKKPFVWHYDGSKNNKVFEISAKQCRANGTKTILIWNNFFGMPRFFLEKGRTPFLNRGCKVNNCAIWERRDVDADLDHDLYDAVLFHGIETSGALRDDLPLVRRAHQRYLFVLKEPPILRPQIYNHDYFFNWTITYRPDSDIYDPYGQIMRKQDTPNVTGDDWREPTFFNMTIPLLVRNRTKLIAWVVSNPNAPSMRYEYVKRLSQYIPIDIYGNMNTKCEEEQCRTMLKNTYKFYLSFENSLCNNYVTEKFFWPLNSYVVPIVYGGINYGDIAPPLSYIDVKDFSSPQELAKYLTFLHNNPEEYYKYFWWRKFYTTDRPGVEDMWCRLCDMLNDKTLPVKTYNITSWWFYDGVCHSPEHHFKFRPDSSMCYFKGPIPQFIG